ncbi:MAG: ROK family protein [Halobacteriales archaeon]
MSYYLGVDLGATNLRAVLGTDSGAIVTSHRRTTPSGPEGTTVTAAVIDAIEALVETADIDLSDIAAAGIGAIGPLDLDAGAVVRPTNFPDAVDRIPLREPVKELLDTDHVVLQNDTVAGVIGERFYGTATPDNLVYLTISTGIGAGVIVDGEVLNGEQGNVGEVGHQVIDADGRRCSCGLDGHWEAYCSGRSIPGYAHDLYDRWNDETTIQIERESFGAMDVLEAVGDDSFADHIAERLAYWNTIGVANLVHAYAPAVVRIGGAVALNHPTTIIDPVRDRLEDVVITTVPTIEPATLGEDAVVRGALASAIIDTGGDAGGR